MKNTNNIMLHMKLKNAVCTAALLAFLPASAFMIVSPARAGVCFLPDCDLSGTPPVACIDCKWCEDHGYYFNCPDGTAADYSQTCFRDESYTKCTKEQYCKNKGYTKSAQSCYDLGPTWYPKDKCPNGLDLYKSCIENRPQACKDNGYVNNCSRPNKNEICPWDSSYAKCCNDTPSNGCPDNSKVSGCESGAIIGKDSCGYECRQCCKTSCPAGYAYTDKETSGGTTGYIKDGTDYCMHCTKGRLYKRKENPCTGYDVCSAYGGVDNGDYCYSGSLKKYSKCLTECRPGYVEWCDTPVTDCDKLGYRYNQAACDGVPSVACPFDETKWFCEKKDYSAIPKEGGCCGYSGCGYNAMSHSSDSYCQLDFGMSCYNKCIKNGYPDCNDMQASCRASGGTPVFDKCNMVLVSYNVLDAYFTCK
ncbi:MAG: hypothetical protein J6L86_04390 [Alphaproteobacteria bacterium]|nr:hypothetical protein [Alphaproteobacteria bacterium]